MERQWGGRSILIMRWKCCEQEYNIELVMEECGMSEALLVSGGWCRRKWTTGVQKLIGDGLGDNG
ncbi:hypothetical protein T01_10624 [Trichinella spiralis]|uniref:Uncharacterized protein n=1 Tax=Trichinella spiralis TaxID=6334 RepID=A0A0V1AI70_TRISP|nr:hypothetical protein T01_10624 [Trichinella spiralis]